MYRTSCDTKRNTRRISAWRSPPHSARKPSTMAAISALVLAMCGAQSSAYQRETSRQSAAVETRTFCTWV